jgi:hypothetical protein
MEKASILFKMTQMEKANKKGTFGESFKDFFNPNLL